MKYVISAIFFTILFSVVIGIADLFISGSFMHGFFPTGEESWLRWFIRGCFIAYMTITRPIKLI